MSLRLKLYIQIALDIQALPDAHNLHRWVTAALTGAKYKGRQAELTIRMVNETESADLNEAYRYKKGPTNILSFPFTAPMKISPLGDIVICAPVVIREAMNLGINLDAHWAHLIVHGVLHLLGHDHDNKDKAEIMESLEIRILAWLGYPDPYGDPQDS
jgi:probable rRNA maturation factor